MVNKEFQNELRTLNREDSLIYCIHITKRLWPDYIRFYEMENFGDVFLINDILQAAAAFIKHHTTREEEIHLLKERLDKATPDSEDFSSIESTYALDVCCCCFDILALLKDHDAEAAVRAYDIAMETAYIKIAEDQTSDDLIYEDLYDSLGMRQEEDLHKLLVQRIKTGNRADLIKDTFDLSYRE